MACGIGVCMTCVLPVVGEDGRTRFSRSCVEGPVFGGDRVRFADVGTLPWDVVGADAMGVVAAVTLVETAVDMSTSLGPVAIPSPVLTASGLLGVRPGAGAVRRPDRHRRGGHQVGAAAAALGPADPADGRDAQRDAQLDRPAGPRHRRAARRRPAVAGRARGAGLRLDRRHPGRGLRRAGRAAARRAGRAGPRGQHQLPERGEPRRGVRLRPGRRLRRRLRRPRRRPTRPSRSTPSSAPTSPTSSASPGRCPTPAPTGSR